MLKKFYANQEKYSFAFQIMAYISRLTILRQTIKNIIHDKINQYIIITERSLYTDKHVFAKMLYESGNISEIEWLTYSYWFDTFKDKTKLDLILYVNTKPDECYNRIIKRSRPEEVDKISKDYLTTCHQKHIDWFKETESKIIDIDGHESIDEVMNKVKEILKGIINTC